MHGLWFRLTLRLALNYLGNSAVVSCCLAAPAAAPSAVGVSSQPWTWLCQPSIAKWHQEPFAFCCRLQNAVAAEREERVAEDDEIVAAVNDYTRALQDGLRILANS